MNATKIIEKASSYFISGSYNEALFLYSQLCQYEPDNEEYKIYPILCDIGYENHNKAQMLFDYFEISKNENRIMCVKNIKKMISKYDKNNNQAINIMNDLSRQNQDSLDAIRYEDFNKLIQSRGSFKIAYEDIMFSTKVTISSKEQFFDFIEKLIENGFYSTTYKYLEEYSEFFAYDKEIENYYKVLKNKQK